MKHVLLVAAALMCGEVGWTQEPPVFSSSVEMVRLDVAVTHKGQPIENLTAQHFEVRDNGVVRQVEVVAREEKPVHAVLALDNSGSVAGDRLARLKVAARALVDVLGPNDAVTLLTFSSRIALRARPGEPRERVHAAIEATEAQLSTSLYDATFAALAVADSRRGRPVVLLFTDGQDVGSWLRPDQVLRAARSADLVADAVVSGQAQSDTSFLDDLTAATGGEVWKAGDLELEEAFLQALGQFRSRYTLQYPVDGDGAEGWHEIDVRVHISGAKVRVREGYLRGRAPDRTRID